MAQDELNPAQEIIALEKLTPEKVFTEKGGDPIIEKIRALVAEEPRDIATPEGRKAVASLAYKVARSKTFMDNLGKELVAGIKKQASVIDKERSRIWDALETIQKEVRAPLDEFEAKEERRVAAIQDRIKSIIEAGNKAAAGWDTLSVADLNALGQSVADTLEGFDFQEFANSAESEAGIAAEKAFVALERRMKAEADKAELERLRAEAAQREQEAREAQIAQEAAERAQREEQARAAEAQRKADEERKAAEERAARAEREKAEAEQRAIEQAEAAAKAAQEAAERAEREKAAAVEAALKAERERMEAEQAEAQRKAELAAADKQRQEEIRSSAISGLCEVLEPEDAGDVFELIQQGKVPHIVIAG